MAESSLPEVHPGTIIRAAVREDLNAIAEVHVESRRSGYSSFFPAHLLMSTTAQDLTVEWAQHLGNAELTVLVLEEATEVCGVIAFGKAAHPWPTDHAGFVEALYVRPANWHRGFGSSLLKAAETQLMGRGFTTAYLGVYRENELARRFYETNGWAFDGGSWTFNNGGHELSVVRYRKDLRLAQGT